MENFQPDYIFGCKYGSHLYGTNTETSDIDTRHVFFPSLKLILLGTAPKNIVKQDEKEDRVDLSIFEFFKLATEGQAMALEMLNTDKYNTLYNSAIWQSISSRKEIFLSKQMQSFVGYAQAMAGKYQLRSERREFAESVLKVLELAPEETTLMSIWDNLPVHNNGLIASKGMRNRGNIQSPVYMVLGRMLYSTISVKTAKDTVSKILKSYGSRVSNAVENVDWKSISHAFRVAYEVIELAQTKKIKFPLKNSNFLLELKQGKHHFINDNISYRLDLLINEAEEALIQSDLPDKPNQAEIDALLLDICHLYYKINNLDNLA